MGGDRLSGWRATGLVFALSFVLLFAAMDRHIGVFDESLMLTHAGETMRGALVHRDFHSSYGPLYYWLLGLVLSASPYTFIAGRLFGIAWMAAMPATVFALLDGRTRHWPRAGTTLLVLCLLGCFGAYLSPMWPSLLLAVLSTLALLRWAESGARRDVLLAGALTGINALIRYDSGFFVALTHVLLLALMPPLAERKAPDWHRIASAVAHYALASITAFAPFALFYLAQASVQTWWIDWGEYGLRYYGPMRGLPFPGPAQLLHYPPDALVYLPPIMALAGLALARGGKGLPLNERRFLIAMALLALVFFQKGYARVGWAQMMMAIIPALLIAAIVVDRLWQGRRTLALALIAAISIPVAAAGAFELRAQIKDPFRSAASGLIAGTLFHRASPDLAGCDAGPAMALARVSDDEARAFAMLRQVTLPGEPVFAASDRHDRLFVNLMSTYVATGRPPATRYSQFDPGFQTRADIQQALIADLERTRVRWVLRDSRFSAVIEPNRSAISSGVFLLDRYLATHFRPVARSGTISLWLAKGEPAPPIPAMAACMPLGLN